ncbi:NUDIX hydrolase [Siccirubricoccus deserti]|uniref:GDP-mannose pyrophosphatase n=2 Tax=Siccirubricoccus deserti TaxID=2013562 RepID=A0A9X0QZS8_9PROT|nr:NUDIX hydrolase [Siccirubricoccus deserti]
MRVREDRIRRRDGTEGLYGFIEKTDFVVVAAVQDGMLHLVQQYRYPIRQRQWELPQGAWEGRPEARPEDVARGELREETGLIASEITEVGHLFPLYGTSTQAYRIFLATGLVRGERSPDPEEQDLVTRAFPLAEVEAMILDGTIRDAATVAALGMLRLRRLV